MILFFDAIGGAFKRTSTGTRAEHALYSVGPATDALRQALTVMYSHLATVYTLCVAVIWVRVPPVHLASTEDGIVGR